MAVGDLGHTAVPIDGIGARASPIMGTILTQGWRPSITEIIPGDVPGRKFQVLRDSRRPPAAVFDQDAGSQNLPPNPGRQAFVTAYPTALHPVFVGGASRIFGSWSSHRHPLSPEVPLRPDRCTWCGGRSKAHRAKNQRPGPSHKLSRNRRPANRPGRAQPGIDARIPHVEIQNVQTGIQRIGWRSGSPPPPLVANRCCSPTFHLFRGGIHSRQ